MTWVCQQQMRDARTHGVVRLEQRQSFTDDTVGEDIRQFLIAGWNLERQDSISVTLRSDVELSARTARYYYRHYWREGL